MFRPKQYFVSEMLITFMYFLNLLDNSLNGEIAPESQHEWQVLHNICLQSVRILNGWHDIFPL